MAPAWPAGTWLLLHGLGPTRVTFRRVAAALAAEGWTPCAVRHPSARLPLVRLAEGVAELLADLAAARVVFGSALKDLRPGRPATLPSLPLPCLVIAGQCPLNPLLTGPDDGTVTVSETGLPGTLHAVIPAQHTVIADHPKAIALIKTFLACSDAG